MGHFPVSLDDVDAAWLTGALRSSGALGAASVADFDAEPVGVGVGLMGLLYRLTLRYDAGGEGPDTVVLKVASVDEGARHVARVFRFYEKEVGFYRDFARLTPVSTAACYAAAHDPEADEFVLLFSDVADGVIHSQIDGCPPALAELAARTLARHHAAFADSVLFDRPEHTWLPHGSDSPTPEGVIQGVTDSWGPFQQKFPELVNAEIEEIVARYPGSVSDLMKVPDGRPVTLAHGDYRLDNLFFRPDGDITVIDWQLCCKTSFAYDLAYFVSQSMTVADRRAHEVAIIDAYLEELAANGCHHDRDDFMADYRSTVMFCLCYPLQSGAIELVNDRARALVADMFCRAMAAIEDHNATEFLTG